MLLKRVAAEEGGGISEEGESHPLFRELFPRPAGVVRPVEVGLGVGHQAEDPARLVADPGDRVDRAVGVCRIVRRRLPIFPVAVLEGDQVLPVEAL